MFFYSLIGGENISINVGTAVAYLTLDRSGFKNNIRSAGTELKNFVKGTGGAEGKVKSLGNALTSTGKAMIKPSIAAGGFLGAATNTAMNFESQMSKVQAISGANGQQLEKLKNTAREWGSKTKFSAKEAGEAMEYMAMAGWKTKQMTEGLPGILNLAAASGEELGTASDIVTDALTAFGLKAKDSAHFSDILASASSNSNTNVSLLGESFKYCAPVAGALGISAKDTSFALGLMANAGIKGSSSGTALRASLVNLAKPSKQMKDAMDKLGISLTDSNGKVKSGKVLFDELREKFSTLSDAQKAQYASTIFGKEAMSGMLAVINASDKDYNNLYKNLSNCNGTAEKMANTMQNNLKGAITNFKSAFEEMQIGLVQALLPAFTKVVKVVTKAINLFNKLPQPIKNVVGILLAGIAMLAPVFLILGKLVTTVSTVIKSFKTLANGAKVFSMLPSLITPHTLIIVGAIAACGFIVYEVIKHWKGLSNAGKKLYSSLSNTCKKIGNFFKKSIQGWKWAWQDFKKFMSNIGEFISDGLCGGLKKGWGKVKDTVHNMAEGIKKGFKGALGIHSPSRVFSSYGGYIIEGLSNGLENNVELAYSKVSSIGKNIKNSFKDQINEFKNDSKDSLQDFSEDINLNKNMFDKLANIKDHLNIFKNIQTRFSNIGLKGEDLSANKDLSNVTNNKTIKEFKFNPTIYMTVKIDDTKSKGTEQLTTEITEMGKNAVKNSMVNLFMKDAIRN